MPVSTKKKGKFTQPVPVPLRSSGGCGNYRSSRKKIAQNALENLQGKLFFRKDIGTAALIQKRIDHMKEIRG